MEQNYYIIWVKPESGGSKQSYIKRLDAETLDRWKVNLGSPFGIVGPFDTMEKAKAAEDNLWKTEYHTK